MTPPSTTARLAPVPAALATAIGRLPDFLIIGAAKCGTTTLYEYLCRHPRVMMSEPKEPEYFSRASAYAQGEAWYRALFAGARADQLCGEASTTYTRWPHTEDAATRIARTLPEARLIYIMRPPVERTWSHYAHHMRLGVSRTFEEALGESDIYVDCSLYMRQIRRYLRNFSREQMLFLLLEDLSSDPDAVLGEVQRFLGLPERRLCDAEPLTANASGADHFIRAHTTRALRRVPGVSLLADRMPRSLRARAYELIKQSPVGRRLGEQARLEPMKPQTRAALLERFAPGVDELAEFLGRDLSHWKR